MFHSLHELAVRLWQLQPKPGRTKCDFLSLHDITTRELEGLLDLAADVKAYPADFHHALEGRTAALIFEKPSLRTRVTFEAGLHLLGGHPIYLAPGDVGLGRRESVRDVARNLARDEARTALRRRRHLVLLQGAAQAEESAEPEAPERMERSQDSARVRQALEALSDRDREVLLLWDAGLSYEDIAQQTGLALGAIGTTLARARRRLVDAYETMGGRDVARG